MKNLRIKNSHSVPHNSLILGCLELICYMGRAQEEGGEVRQHTRFGKNQEPGGVRDQIQPVDLLVRLPSDPPVPRGTLERALLPSGQSAPQTSKERHIPQPTPCETPEPEIMVRVHHRIKARPLGRRDQTDHDIGEREALRRFPKNGVGVRIRRYHAPHITQPVMECQKKNTPPAYFFARRAADMMSSRARATDQHAL